MTYLQSIGGMRDASTIPLYIMAWKSMRTLLFIDNNCQALRFRWFRFRPMTNLFNSVFVTFHLLHLFVDIIVDVEHDEKISSLYLVEFLYVNMLLCSHVSEPLLFFCHGVCVGVTPHSSSCSLLLRQRYFSADRMLIPRLKAEQKRAAAITTTDAHMGIDDNTEPGLYMTTARQHQTPQAQTICAQTLQQPIRRQENPQIQLPLRQFNHSCALVSFGLQRFHPGCLAGCFCFSLLLFSSVQVRAGKARCVNSVRCLTIEVH